MVDYLWRYLSEALLLCHDSRLFTVVIRNIAGYCIVFTMATVKLQGAFQQIILVFVSGTVCE